MTLCKQNHLKTGRLGEWLACLYFIVRGFKIIGRNIRSGAGETDLIVYRKKVWHLVEVRTRSQASDPQSLESILPFRKRQQLYLNRQRLLTKRFFRDVEESDVHIDCLWIIVRGWRLPEFRHIRNVDGLEPPRIVPY